MSDAEDQLEDEDAEEVDDLDEAEPSEEDLADATVPPDPATGGDVESIQELIVKQEAAAEKAEAADDEDVLLAVPKDDKLPADPTETRVVPIQETEFVCKRCFLVKHRGQLADKKKMLCRDCA
jgi:Domain of unknown function (DUF4193)